MNFAANTTTNTETHLKQKTTMGRPTADNEVNNENEPIPFDSDTPDVSQHENYPWPARDLQTLHSYAEYFREMGTFVSLAIRDGPNLNMIMLKTPKPTLKSVFVKPKPKQILLGVELHEYLKKYLVDNADINVDDWNPISLDNVKRTLLDGFHIMKQRHAGLFSHYLHFGKILNYSFDYFSICKLRGDVHYDLTWAKWLEDNVGISIPYSKQLRSVAKDFGAFEGFHYLGISFNEFFKRKEHIRLMLVAFPDLDHYWRNIKP